MNTLEPAIGNPWPVPGSVTCESTREAGAFSEPSVWQ